MKKKKKNYKKPTLIINHIPYIIKKLTSIVYMSHYLVESPKTKYKIIYLSIIVKKRFRVGGI